MKPHRIRITQVCKATCSFEIEVEAEDEDDAVEGVSSGAIDTPDFDHPGWQTGWELQDEEVEPA